MLMWFVNYKFQLFTYKIFCSRAEIRRRIKSLCFWTDLRLHFFFIQHKGIICVETNNEFDHEKFKNMQCHNQICESMNYIYKRGTCKVHCDVHLRTCGVFRNSFSPVRFVFVAFHMILREGKGRTLAVRRCVTCWTEWRRSASPGTPSCGHIPSSLDAPMLTWRRNTGAW